MPIFMDIHLISGVKARDVAEAHQKDLLFQHDYHCKCMTYWVDEERENVFCLIEAPDKDAVEKLHSKSHGLGPNKVIEVDSGLVSSFLGRIYDPSDAHTTTDGLKVFHDPSFRVLLVTAITDPVLLNYQMGDQHAATLLNKYNEVVRKHFAMNEGREVEQGGDGMIGSFTSAARAIACAVTIHQEFSPAEAEKCGLRMAIHAGEPVSKSDKLFGEALQLAGYMCAVSNDHRVAISSLVKELVPGEYLRQHDRYLLSLSPQDEALLISLFGQLEARWQDPDFSVEDYCSAMAMSKSQLYRKATNLSGLSPNSLLKEYRLEKAKEMIRKQRFTISQVTFDTGFTSPSYFTKCFKKKYGLLPNAYADLLP